METNHLIHSDAIFIIGGGPSVKGLNLNPLMRMGYVLGVNDAFFHTLCHGVASMDGRWMSHRLPDLRQQGIPFFASGRHLKKWVKEPVYFARLFEIDINQKGMSDSSNIIFAKHSGAFALNIAYLSKPKQIYLFGFDHTDAPDMGDYSEHWYGQYPWRPIKRVFRHMHDWVLEHNYAAQQFKRAGIEVFNVSKISKITAYERISFEEVGNHLSRIQTA